MSAIHWPDLCAIDLPTRLKLIVSATTVLYSCEARHMIRKSSHANLSGPACPQLVSFLYKKCNVGRQNSL